MKDSQIKKTLTLSKRERLKSRKLIEHLFRNGDTFNVFPLKVFSLLIKENNGSYLQAGFGVSVKKFKKATDRNRVKRLMKEAYRLQKSDLETTVIAKQTRLALFFIFTGSELPVFSLINEKLGLTLKRLQSKLDENNPPGN